MHAVAPTMSGGTAQAERDARRFPVVIHLVNIPPDRSSKSPLNGLQSQTTYVPPFVIEARAARRMRARRARADALHFSRSAAHSSESAVCAALHDSLWARAALAGQGTRVQVRDVCQAQRE